ncbi:MAG: chitobiase/beta-hexosaminidase C-terminal domain-containing protein [Leptospiraceae bacterium]|nr:chitobiase/beta-hexosaminidase C-terminal domain-containing protein [Leptospiraceae bacterium]
MVSPSASGNSTIYSIKAKRDIAWTGTDAYMESVIREPEKVKPDAADLTSAENINTSLPNANVSPLTHIAARRIQTIAKTDTDLNSATKQANGEVSLRFNLFSSSGTINTGLPSGTPAPNFAIRQSSSSNGSIAVSSEVPDISRYNIDTTDLKNEQTQKLLLILGGLEQLATDSGSTTDLNPEAIEKIMDSLAESMATGEFKSTKENGEAISIGSGENEKNMGDNPLNNLLAKAIKQYAYEGGAESLGLNLEKVKKSITFYDKSEPSFTPSPGSYSGFQGIELKAIESSQEIRYTLNGGAPTCSSGTVYTSPIPLTQVGNYNIKAVACKNGISSRLIVGEFKVLKKLLSEPSFNSDAGEYNNSHTVSLSHAEGGKLYYTLDGSIPDCEGKNGTLYNSAITMNVSFRLATIACNGSLEESNPLIKKYVILNSPYGLSYKYMEADHNKNGSILPNYASVTGERITYSISPALPEGLIFSTLTGSIKGTPIVESPVSKYTVTARNAAGSVSAEIQITVNENAPSIMSYSETSVTYTQGVLIKPNTVIINGSGMTYSVSPNLPSGLILGS